MNERFARVRAFCVTDRLGFLGHEVWRWIYQR